MTDPRTPEQQLAEDARLLFEERDLPWLIFLLKFYRARGYRLVTEIQEEACNG